MSRVLVASITDLCAADHHDDAAFLARWLHNKSPEMVGRMLANPRLSLFVAERDGAVAAVGAIEGADSVALNYVAPAHRFVGVSSALLAALEAEMARRGASVGRLVSTLTAERFYRSRGWMDDTGAEVPARGVALTKQLAEPYPRTSCSSPLRASCICVTPSQRSNL